MFALEMSQPYFKEAVSREFSCEFCRKLHIALMPNFFVGKFGSDSLIFSTENRKLEIFLETVSLFSAPLLLNVLFFKPRFTLFCTFYSFQITVYIVPEDL
jgi:hypothetical protein